MNHTIRNISCSLISLSSLSLAGGKSVVDFQPLKPNCSWESFAGAEGGYLFGNWDDPIVTAHLGRKFKCPDKDVTHALYLELGYTQKEHSWSVGPPAPSLQGYEASIIPLTLNYEYERRLTGKLRWDVGAGAGFASVDVDFIYPSNTIVPGDDIVFYSHIHTGIKYTVSENLQVSLGVNYVMMDTPNVFGSAVVNDIFDITGDLHVNLGFRYTF